MSFGNVKIHGEDVAMPDVLALWGTLSGTGNSFVVFTSEQLNELVPAIINVVTAHSQKSVTDTPLNSMYAVNSLAAASSSSSGSSGAVESALHDLQTALTADGGIVVWANFTAANMPYSGIVRINITKTDISAVPGQSPDFVVDFAKTIVQDGGCLAYGAAPTDSTGATTVTIKYSCAYSTEIFGQWWFWLAIGGGLSLILVIVIFVLMAMSRRSARNTPYRAKDLAN